MLSKFPTMSKRIFISLSNRPRFYAEEWKELGQRPDMRRSDFRSDLADGTRSGTGPVDRSHHRANRNGSGTVPLRSHRAVVGSFRNEWTQWNRSEHGQLERFRNRSGFTPVV